MIYKDSLLIAMPLFILWFLWIERNHSRHRNVSMNANRVIRRSYYLTDALIKAGLITPVVRKKVQYAVAVVWKKPEFGWAKLNTDGALKGSGLAAGGGVIRNSKGDFILGFYEFYGRCSILEAELKAVATGIKLCWQNGISKVWVEIDSRAALILCTQQNTGPWEVQYTLEFIHQSARKMEIHFSHIWREGNKVADWFANKGYADKCSKVIQGSDIQGIARGLIRMDKLGMASIRLVP